MFFSSSFFPSRNVSYVFCFLNYVLSYVFCFLKILLCTYSEKNSCSSQSSMTTQGNFVSWCEPSQTKYFSSLKVGVRFLECNIFTETESNTSAKFSGKMELTTSKEHFFENIKSTLFKTGPIQPDTETDCRMIILHLSDETSFRDIHFFGNRLLQWIRDIFLQRANCCRIASKWLTCECVHCEILQFHFFWRKTFRY